MMNDGLVFDAQECATARSVLAAPNETHSSPGQRPGLPGGRGDPVYRSPPKTAR